MTTRTWNGSTDSFSNAADWSPTGVPVTGDTAVINSGSVLLAAALTGIAVQLTETLGSTASTTLTLNGASIDSTSTLTVNNQNAFNGTAPTIAVTGSSTFAGTASFYAAQIQGAQIAMTIAAGTTLTNTGTMNFYATSPQISGGGALVNNGTIALLNPNNVAQVPVVSDSITGSGTIALGTRAKITIAGAVGSGQTVVMNDGATGNETLQLNAAGSFGAQISGFSSSDLIAVINTPYTSATYTSTGANSGVLVLLNGATQQAAINFIGSYTLGSFNLTYNDFGGGLSNLQIRTTAVNTVSAGLPAGYQNGGNGALPMYRFFDTTFGTHLFTASTSEVATIKATRTDLTEETNGFGSVSQSDPNAVPVYRFFNLNDGTHFYTSSQTEFAGLTTPGTSTYRADLAYEPTSTLYEHAIQQAGDLAVYRLFDTVHGTQFLTGDQGEYNGITTAGSSTYRPDLKPEGVAFYAPSGSFYA